MPSQALTQLCQSQIWLGLDPSVQLSLERFNTRTTIPTHGQRTSQPFLLKALANLMHPHAADLKAPGNCTGAFSSFQRTKYSVTQIL